MNEPTPFLDGLIIDADMPINAEQAEVIKHRVRGEFGDVPCLVLGSGIKAHPLHFRTPLTNPTPIYDQLLTELPDAAALLVAV